MEIPGKYSVFNYEISLDDRSALFDLGETETAKFLDRYGRNPFVAYIREFPTDIRKTLQARFGDPKLFEPVLWAIAKEVEETTRAEDVRAYIKLRTGRDIDGARSESNENETHLTVYSYGMIEDQRPDGSIIFDLDYNLEFPLNCGTSGRAWENKRFVIADLQAARDNPNAWGLTYEQQRAVPEDRAVVLCIPIFLYPESLDPVDTPVIATLSIDTSTTWSDNNWVDSASGNLIDRDLHGRLKLWTEVLRRLLQ